MVIEVGNAGNKGRGVFASQYIPSEFTFEIAPVILVPNSVSEETLEEVGIYTFLYEWEKEQSAFVLGYGSLYNHDSNPNAEYYMDYETKTLEYWSLRDIEPGEEITVDYGITPYW